MSEFVEYLNEVFAEFGAIQSKKMFGGYGIYHDGVMFALVSDDTLYLKADETTRNAVVIFLSALQNTQEKVRGLSMGAMDFITKPFDLEEIVARVSLQLGVHRRQQELLWRSLGCGVAEPRGRVR